MHQINENQFLKLPKNAQEFLDPDYIDKSYVKNKFQPYQQKKFYQIKDNSSDLVSVSSENEDDLAA